LDTSWRTTYRNLLTGRLVGLYQAAGITVKWSIYLVLISWLLYVIGMAGLENICDCSKDFNNWWTAEYWIKKEGA